MNERQTADRHTASLGAQELDPVCGMKVDPATSKHRFDHGGRIFHFWLCWLPEQVRSGP